MDETHLHNELLGRSRPGSAEPSTDPDSSINEIAQTPHAVISSHARPTNPDENDQRYIAGRQVAQTMLGNSQSPSVMSEQLRSPTGASTGIYNSTLIAGRDINIQTIENDSVLRKLKIDLRPVSAAFDSFASPAGRRSGCFEGTRVKLISEIIDWVEGRGGAAPVYVLDGVAGIGKSTVAQTVAEQAAFKGILGASFFYSGTEQDRATGKHFFTTIAFQLACHSTELQQAIFNAIKEHPDIEQKDIFQQFTVLIFNPLRALQPGAIATSLVVVDALDECDHEDAKSILTLLVHNIAKLPILKFFITSRPEFHINNILGQGAPLEQVHLHNIEDSVVQADIQLYLDSHFSPHNLAKIFPHSTWKPSIDEMQKLYNMCGTLFIIASTAIKFVLDDACMNPSQRLLNLLAGFSSSNPSDSQQNHVLDKTYIQILQFAGKSSGYLTSHQEQSNEKSWYSYYQTIIGAIIVLQKPLPVAALSCLLQIETGYIKAALKHLHSLVAPHEPSYTFQLHHKSFPDFITSKDRIQKALEGLGLAKEQVEAATLTFLIDPSLHHWQTARQCLNIMKSDLHYNMCNLMPKDWYKEKAEIEHLYLNCPIKHEILYSCLYWTVHLSQSSSAVNKELLEFISYWAVNNLLSWIEVMAMAGCIHEALFGLQTTNSLLRSLPDMDLTTAGLDQEKEMDNPLLKKLSTRASQLFRSSSQSSHADYTTKQLQQRLNDCYRFLQLNAAVVQISPMHVYWSALPFVPAKTSVFQHYYNLQGKCVIVNRKENWDHMLATLVGHSLPVYPVLFSHKGTRLASGSDDSTVRLWDPETGSHISTLEGHSGYISCISSSFDEAHLASSGSNDKTVRLWDAKLGSHITTLKGHDEQIIGIAFSPDGTKLVSGSRDGTIKLWNLKTYSPICTTKGHSHSINYIAFSSDGTKMATGSGDETNTIGLWDRNACKEVSKAKGHSKKISSMVFSPNGTKLASGSDDKTVKLWNTETGLHLFTLKGHSDGVKCLAFSPDGARLASGSKDRTVRLWSAETGSHISTLRGHGNTVVSVAFSLDGSRLASGSLEEVSRLWNAKTGSHISTLRGHTAFVPFIAFSPDGTKLATGSDDTTIRLWDATTDLHSSTSKVGNSLIRSISFLDSDEIARLWEAKKRSLFPVDSTFVVRKRFTALSPDGTSLATWTDYSSDISLQGMKPGSHVFNLKGHNFIIYTVLFSPDGTQVASTTDSVVKLWNTKTGSNIATLEDHGGWIRCIAFSPDGTKLASGCSGNIRLWSTKTGSQISMLEGHSDAVRCIVFSPDGRRLASGSDDKTVKLWNVETGSHIATLGDVHCNSIISITFSPDGSRLASGSSDTAVGLWDGQTGSHITTLKNHSDEVTLVAFSPDGALLATLSYDRTVNIWDGNTGSYLYTISSYNILSLAFLPMTSIRSSSSISKLVLLLQRQNAPCVYGLGIHYTQSPEVHPICWLPADTQPVVDTRPDDDAIALTDSKPLAIYQNGSHVALGYQDGVHSHFILMLDISSLELP